jgi:hypothetical protein
MSFPSLARWGAPLLGVLAFVALCAVLVRPAAAQDSELLYRVVAPESAAEGDADIVVEIRAENAENLAAFSFQLTYDPDVLQIAEDQAGQPLIQRGDFLGSSGREVACPEPEIQSGVLRMVCTTLRLEPAGADGDGTLATITFLAVGSGNVDLTLERPRANEPDATEINPISVQSATMDVQGEGGMNWLIWGPILFIAALVIIGVIAFVVTRVRPGDKTTAPAT